MTAQDLMDLLTRLQAQRDEARQQRDEAVHTLATMRASVQAFLDQLPGVLRAVEGIRAVDAHPAVLAASEAVLGAWARQLPAGPRQALREALDFEYEEALP